jgi:cbb3-type cytochrome c oxidase subunit III
MARTRRWSWLGLIALLGLIGGGVFLRQRSIEHRTLLMRNDPDAILTDARARALALSDGKRVFERHCAACHGADGKGSTARAVPDLTDADFLYGDGMTGEIEQIVLHGIRAGDSKGWDLAAMPAFAQAVPYAREKLPPLTPAQIHDLVGFLRAANGNGGYDRATIDRGRMLFTRNAGCWDCHSDDGQGDNAIGAPNLVDGKWLKGDGSEGSIAQVLEHGLAGSSPAFARTLSPYQARAVAAYTASLHPIGK